jgi:phage tail sheath gpL-like
MAITFEQMPSSRRTPGRYVEFNTRLASRGLRANPIKVLFIGQRLAAGSKSALELDAISTGSQARDYYGRGSILALMLEAGLRANGSMQAWAMALDDNGGGTAGTQTITISGTPDADQSVSVWVAGQKVDVAITTADDANAIAAAIDAALDNVEVPDLPMTPSVTTNVVTLTARNKGTLGNGIDVHVEFSGTGVSAVVATGITGATDPDVAGATALLASEDFDFIAIDQNVAGELNDLETFLDGLPHPLVGKGAIGVFATTGTITDATTLAANYSTSGYMVGVNFPGSPTWSPVLAAVMTAVLASQEDPALPYNNLPLPGVLNPWSLSDKLTPTEAETALFNGVCPIVVGAGQQARILRAITTYTENDSAEADDALLDVTTPRILFWLRAQVVSMLGTKYPRAKNTARRRQDIRSDILGLLYTAEDLEILENVEANEDGVLVELNADPSRTDIAIPADVVNGLHVLAARIDLIL